ncbi:DUF3455 domain-containing protein [Paraburkholderia edwinii]|jgi:hypothetical protein|uniref:DUF3455 domain-containing protein n=1 Tax=Paraburkholderia edwinii TaxID=2861782 RepID=UPI001FE868A1|nr:DUF3455 domain-containing protein [Paraburkholderia edwinii]
MFRNRLSIFRVCTVLAAACLAAGSVPAQSAVSTSSSLTPLHATPYTSTTATGVQIYMCEYDSAHHLAWLFRSPQATLYDTVGRAVFQHDAGPSWQAHDGSRIVGHPIAQMASASPGSIPQLLLETTSDDKNGNSGGNSGGELSGVRYVQRLNTVGGSAPAQMCTAEHQVAYSPYFANYVFWK